MNENSWLSRWSKDQVRAMLLEQSQTFWQRDTGIEREQLAVVERAAAAPHAVIISGLRRVRKSTLLRRHKKARALAARQVGLRHAVDAHDKGVRTS